MSTLLFASLASADITSALFYQKTDHIVTVACALAAILSGPDTLPDAPPDELPATEYRRVVELTCPGRQFEDVDAELVLMHEALEAQFANGLREAADNIRTHKRLLEAVIAKWESTNPAVHNPEPAEICAARNGVIVASALINSADNRRNVPVISTCGKLALLVVEKMGHLGLLRHSQVDKDAAFQLLPGYLSVKAQWFHSRKQHFLFNYSRKDIRDKIGGKPQVATGVVEQVDVRMCRRTHGQARRGANGGEMIEGDAESKIAAVEVGGGWRVADGDSKPGPEPGSRRRKAGGGRREAGGGKR
ncbi:hypothetical protein FRC10_004709 [Ceratobasidium sp. 414]|nr:hypothetical protein FRC10_004709 [Ceratobasidium sp. 414]